MIPARYASTRFPGKPLIDIAGKSMVMRVYEQVCKARLVREVIVATDDSRIYEHVQAAGGQAMMTASDHQSGTDRIAELARAMKGIDLVINVQGDEPFIQPESIDRLIEVFVQKPAAQIATLACPIHHPEEIDNPNVVKVVLSRSHRALYFSRSPIPFKRDASQTAASYHRHLGIYAFRTDVLLQLAQLRSTALEQSEALEQLRWLDHDFQIEVALTTDIPTAIDTPEDLERLNAWLKQHPHVLTESPNH